MNTYILGEKGKRPWGEWEVLFSGPKLIMKEIRVIPGGRLSLQRHQHRSERWHVSEGIALVTIGDSESRLKVGEIVDIPKRTVHRIENVGENRLIFHEFQTGDVLDEDDIERLQDDYNRMALNNK